MIKKIKQVQSNVFGLNVNIIKLSHIINLSYDYYSFY